MKAIVQDKYGAPENVLQLRDIDPPVANDNQVLVRVHAAGLHAGKGRHHRVTRIRNFLSLIINFFFT